MRRAGFPSIIKLRIGAGGFGRLDGGGWAFAKGLSGRSDGTIGEQGSFVAIQINTNMPLQINAITALPPADTPYVSAINPNNHVNADAL